MMRRPLIPVVCTLLSLFLLAACGKGKEAAATAPKGPYVVEGQWSAADSARQLIVLADHHDGAACDTIQVTGDGTFSYVGATASVDELYFYLPSGEVARMYAAAEGQYTVCIDSLGQLAFAADDSLNGWIQERDSLFCKQVKVRQRRETMDSLCRTYPGELRTALLLRDHALALEDSISVRRCLGRLKPAAKPEWLVSGVDNLLSLKWRQPSNHRERLKPLPTLRCWQDSVLYFNLQDSRTHSVLLYFWADYDSVSIDSLQMFQQLSQQYGLYDCFAKFETKKGRQARRIELLSVCLHADSSTWKSTIASLPGKHCLLHAGFCEENVSAWRINKVPCTMVLDRFSTLLGTDLWGKELRQQLDRATINTDKPKSEESSPKPSAEPAKQPVSRTRKGARIERSR